MSADARALKGINESFTQSAHDIQYGNTTIEVDLDDSLEINAQSNNNDGYIAENPLSSSGKKQKVRLPDAKLEVSIENYRPNYIMDNPDNNNKVGLHEVSILTKFFSAVVAGIIAAIIAGTIIFVGGSPSIGLLVGTIAFLIVDISLMKSG